MNSKQLSTASFQDNDSSKSYHIGAPLTSQSTKMLFLGGGELAKEVVIELQRLGVETIVVDRYQHAPAMQVAHRYHVISMRDEDALRNIIKQEEPDIIVPEIEAIATNVLLEAEKEGCTVIPTARAVQLTMDREAIRALVAKKLGIATSCYRFASDKDTYCLAVKEIGLPCVVKPIMSSSGKGQMVVKSLDDIEKAWDYAATQGRADTGRVIVEAFIEFDYEITLLTVRTKTATIFCEPIGHKQIDGDYQESWQPHKMSASTLVQAQSIAKRVTDELGGCGVFGVEFFVCSDKVIFSEVSPRPHDTGLVTLISQNLSEFALHARAILGLPIPEIECYGAAASAAVVVSGESKNIRFAPERALDMPRTDIRLFGKPEVHGKRRLGVALARDETIEKAREKACKVRDNLEVCL